MKDDRRILNRSWAVAAALALVTAWFRPALAQAPRWMTDQQLYDRARTRVVRLVVHTEPDPARPLPPGSTLSPIGSAVILEADPPEAPRVLTLATAYHVMAGAKSFKVLAASGEVLVASSLPDTLCFADRSRELAFVRVELDAGRGAELKAVDPAGFARVQPAHDYPGERPSGMAFGYSREQSVPLDSFRVDFLGVVTAQALGLARQLNFDQGPGQIYPPQMLFQLLGDQATLEGMSGGAVLSRGGAFAGLIYGRQTDRYNLIIPADLVLQTYRRFLERQDIPWKPLRDAPFRDPSLFRGGAERDEVVEDRLDWGTLEGLTVLLGNDPLNAIERFQEIVVIPPRRSSLPDLEIFVARAECLPTPEHTLEIWVNGKREEIDPLTQTVTLPLRQLPGETMVTVVKGSGSVNDFELSKLLVPSKVDLTFRYVGEAPFRRIVRSLPVITQRYPLFVTIANGSEVRPRPDPNALPANARLAMRLDFAEAVLNQAPFLLQLSDQIDRKDQGLGDDIRYDGVFRLDKKQGWRLQRVSSQRLGLTLEGDVLLKQGEPIRYHDFQVTPRPGPDKVWPPRFRLSGRFQFPYEMPEPGPGNRLGLSLSARATGANGTGALRVEVSKPLEFDIAGILRHLFTSYVNKRIIVTDQPHGIDDDKIDPFLEKLGFSAPGGWRPRIRRAVFVTRPDSAEEWLILTFRVDPERGEGGRPPANADLLAPPDLVPGRVFALEAWGVPGALVARFPGLAPANPVAEAVLKAARADHVLLTLDLDPTREKWFQGLAPAGNLDLRTNNGNDVAERILKALEHAVKTANQVELRAESGPRFVRDVLEAALKRDDVKLGGGERGATLRVVARQGRKGRDVELTMDGGPLELSTGRDQPVNLGGGTTLRGARLKVDRLEAHGTFDSGEVQAQADAELGFDEIKAGGDSFTDISGHVKFSLDAAPDRPKLGTATVEQAALTTRILGIPARIKVNGAIPVTIDKDLNFGFDPRLLNGIPGR